LSGVTIIRRFAQDQRAASAVEFALIAPILLMMLIGMFEITRALTVQRKLVEMAATVNRLVALTNILTQADLEQGANASERKVTAAGLSSAIVAATAVMFPYTAGRAELQVIVDRVDIDDEAGKIAWTYDWRENTGRIPTGTETVAFRPPQNGLLRTRVTYTHRTIFSPILSGVGLSEFTLRSTQMGGSEGTQDTVIEANFYVLRTAADQGDGGSKSLTYPADAKPAQPHPELVEGWQRVPSILRQARDEVRRSARF
jgi:Flp pilus assembly protein TadG